MKNFNKNASAGFTFVEILATLTFAAMVLPVAMRGIAISVSATSDARNRTEANMIARNVISEIKAEGVSGFIPVTGDFMSGTERYRWIADVSETEEAGLHELVVEVFWDARHRENSLVLTTLVYEGKGFYE